MIPSRFDRLVVPSFWAISAAFFITALILVTFQNHLGDRIVMLALAVLLSLAAARDIVTREIDDFVSIGIAALGLVRLFWASDPVLLVLTAVVTLVVFFGASEFWFRRSGGQEALGLGDVKLIAALALLLGPVGLWAMLGLASLGGIVAVLTARILYNRDREKGVPFAPFLGYASLLVFAGIGAHAGGYFG